MRADATATTAGIGAAMGAAMDEIVELEKQRAVTEAAIEKAMARLGALTDEAIRALPVDRQGAEMPLRDISARLGARLRVSDRTIQNRLGEAQTLLAEFPAIVEAWADGRISRGHVRAITDSGERIRDPEVRAQYEEHLLRVAVDESVARTRPVAELMAERLDPVPLAQRHAEARARRTLQLRKRPDAMSRLILDVPAVIGRGIFERATQLSQMERFAFDGTVLCELAGKTSMLEVAVTLRVRAGLSAGPVRCIDLVHDDPSPAGGTGAGDARGDTARAIDPRDAEATGTAVPADARTLDGSWKRVEDPRILDQRRADICAEMLLTGIPTGADPEACAQITAHVRLTVPVLTLTGDDVDPGRAPAELAGRVPVDPATARRLVAQATGWDRVLTHPITGMVLAVDRYRPLEAQRRYLDARDMQCRFVGCTMPAHACDHDHTVEYAKGGPTDVRYLADECRRHHPLRHHSEWVVIARADGVFEWIDPDGRHYRDRPAPTVGFLPDSFYEAQHRRDGLYAHDRSGPPPF